MASGNLIVHFSTDCVYSGKKGNYLDGDIPDAEDVEWFDEKNYPFSMKDMYDNMYNMVPDDKRRRKVSYINQLLKFYAHKVIPDLLDNILI